MSEVEPSFNQLLMEYKLHFFRNLDEDYEPTLEGFLHFAEQRLGRVVVNGQLEITEVEDET